MTTQSTTAIQEELKKIESSLVKENLTREQYLELYSAQQALTWALNSKLVSGAKLTVECPIKPYLGQNPEKRPYLGVSRNTYRVLHQELN